jgi:hypothetical protein
MLSGIAFNIGKIVYKYKFPPFPLVIGNRVIGNYSLSLMIQQIILNETIFLPFNRTFYFRFCI